jgi:hypothetical protein
VENVAAKMAFVPAVPPIAKRDVKGTLVHVILLCVELVHLVTSINMCVAKRANVVLQKASAALTIFVSK